MSPSLKTAASLAQDTARLADAPQTLTTSRVPRGALLCLSGGDIRRRPSDLVLAEITRLGHHRRLHLPDGRLRNLFQGDAVVLAYGDCYASSQFEAGVPKSLEAGHLAAGGGIAARVIAPPARIRRGITEIRSNGPTHVRRSQIRDHRHRASRRGRRVSSLAVSLETSRPSAGGPDPADGRTR